MTSCSLYQMIFQQVPSRVVESSYEEEYRCNSNAAHDVELKSPGGNPRNSPPRGMTFPLLHPQNVSSSVDRVVLSLSYKTPPPNMSAVLANAQATQSESDMALDSESSSASSSAPEDIEPIAIQLSFSTGASGAWDDRDLIKMYDAALDEFHVGRVDQLAAPGEKS